MTHRVAYNPYLHTSDLFATLVRALDHPADRFPTLPETPPDRSTRGRYDPPASDLDAVRRLVCDLAGRPAVPPLVLLNANCGDLLPLRRWEAARYVELARRLIVARPELLIAFTGQAHEAAEAERLVREVSSPRARSRSPAGRRWPSFSRSIRSPRCW